MKHWDENARRKQREWVKWKNERKDKNPKSLPTGRKHRARKARELARMKLQITEVNA